jgi:hypothetical protein
MRSGKWVGAVGTVLLVGACAGTSATPELVPDSSSPDPHVLTAGKSDLPLEAGTYFSPVDFVPPLAITVPTGWGSTHRGDDAFDIGKPGVIVVFDAPEGETVAPVLRALRASAPHPVAVNGTLDGRPATGFDAVGGSGELIKSPSGTIGLDYAAGQRVRVLGADVDGVPLLAVVLVPDGRQWDALLPQAMALLGAVSHG